MPSDPAVDKPTKSTWSRHLPKIAHMPPKDSKTTWDRIRRTFALADIFLGGSLEIYYLYTTPNLDLRTLYTSMVTVLYDPSATTYTLHVMSDQFAWLMLSGLRALLWSTFVMNWKPLHGIWSMKMLKKTRLMPGGFAPRASALALGILLFVSQTLIEETTISGGDLKKQRYWKTRQCCVADHTIPSGQISQYYYQGLFMEPPDGCFRTKFPGAHDLWSSQPPFEKGEAIPFPENLVNPFVNGTNVLRTDRECRYLCLTQRNVEIASLLQKLGIITAGAAVAITVSDSLTAYFGWRLVDEDTTPEELRSLLRKGCLQSGGFPGSALACAFQVHFCVKMATFIAVYILGKTSIHSVDFKINYVMFSGLIIATMQRWWSPMTLRPIVYTKRLWRDGEDEFLVLARNEDGSSSITTKTIDLYTWIHMHRLTRALLLMRYSMRVDTHESVGTLVRCIMSSVEYTLDREGVVVSTSGQKLSVLCRERLTIPLNATGIVLKSSSEHAGKLVVRWDPPLCADTLMNEKHLVENTDEWSDVADELASTIMMEGSKNHCQDSLGELGKRLNSLSSHHPAGEEDVHGMANDMLWGITDE